MNVLTLLTGIYISTYMFISSCSMTPPGFRDLRVNTLKQGPVTSWEREWIRDPRLWCGLTTWSSAHSPWSLLASCH